MILLNRNLVVLNIVHHESPPQGGTSHSLYMYLSDEQFAWDTIAFIYRILFNTTGFTITSLSLRLSSSYQKIHIGKGAREEQSLFVSLSLEMSNYRHRIHTYTTIFSLMGSSQQVVDTSKGTNRLGSKVNSPSTPYYKGHHITPHLLAAGEDSRVTKIFWGAEYVLQLLH